MNIAFIGMGIMGGRMDQNLIRADVSRRRGEPGFFRSLTGAQPDLIAK